MTMNLEYNNQTYQINLNDGVSISIPVQFNKNEHPKFYDDSRILNIVISFLILLILTNFHKYHLHQFYIFLLNIL